MPRPRRVHARRLEELDWMMPTVLVNHFPLVREPCEALFYPEFALRCGTTATARLAHPLQRRLLRVRTPAHPEDHVVRRCALRRGVGGLPARVAAPQALSVASTGTARSAVCARLPQRVRRPLRDHRGDADPCGAGAGADPAAVEAMTAALISTVVPDTVAAAELDDDPPELKPLPEEEPLIARSVAKRRNEFVTVRYCARMALGELGVAPRRS